MKTGTYSGLAVHSLQPDPMSAVSNSSPEDYFRDVVFISEAAATDPAVDNTPGATGSASEGPDMLSDPSTENLEGGQRFAQLSRNQDGATHEIAQAGNKPRPSTEEEKRRKEQAKKIADEAQRKRSEQQRLKQEAEQWQRHEQEEKKKKEAEERRPKAERNQKELLRLANSLPEEKWQKKPLPINWKELPEVRGSVLATMMA
jgi:chromosome segregation ATPase